MALEHTPTARQAISSRGVVNTWALPGAPIGSEHDGADGEADAEARHAAVEAGDA